MPCSEPNHSHTWTTEGELTIERCEKYCGFCGKKFKHGWFTRRHVRTVHEREYPNLMVLKGWTASPQGNRRPRSSPDKRGRRDSTPSILTDRSRSMSSAGARTIEYTTPSRNPICKPNDEDATFTNNTSFTTDNTSFITNNDPFTTQMAIPDDFLDPDLNANLTNNFTSILTSPSLPQIFSAKSSFVTPQKVRTGRVGISGILPKEDHHEAAGNFADGLNNIVEHMVFSGSMTAEEVVWVLETFTSTFKLGFEMPTELGGL